jgi:hypothetical protein
MSYVFSSTKSEKRGWNQFCPEAGVRGEAQVMYTHVSKCKNNKIKILKIVVNIYII